MKMIDYDDSYAKAVAEMWNISSSEWNGAFPHQTEERVRAEESVSPYLKLSLAVEDDVVLGYCKLSVFSGDDDTLYIDLLNVVPERHGTGLGRALLLKALEECRQRGYPRLDLYTWSGNMKAVPLYKKCGFFWEKIDAPRTHLMNFMPYALNCELLQPYFEWIDWYADSQREITTERDGREENGFDFFTYAWKNENGELRLEFEKYSRALRKIDGPDFVLEACIHDAKVVFGLTYDIEYTLINKGSLPLDLQLCGESHDVIDFSFEHAESVQTKSTVKAQFSIRQPESEANIWKTRPSVVCHVRINGRSAVLKLGLDVQFPLGIQFFSGKKLFHLQRPWPLFVNLDNNIKEACSVSMTIEETDGIVLGEYSFSREFSACEKSSVEILARIEKALLYTPNLRIDIQTLETKQRISYTAHPSLTLPVMTGRFFGKTDKHAILCRGEKQFAFSLHESLNYASLHDPYVERAPWLYPPIIGKPYSSEFDNKKPEKISFTETADFLEMQLVFESEDFAPLRFGSIYRLFENGLLECQVEILNCLEACEELVHVLPFHSFFDSLTVPFDGELVKLEKDFPGMELHEWNSDDLTENWIFIEAPDYTLGVAWPDSCTFRFGEWKQSIEFDLAQMQKTKKLLSEPLIFAFNTFPSAQRFRDYVCTTQTLSPHGHNAVDLVVNNGNPFVSSTYTAALVNKTQRYFDADCTLFINNEKHKETLVFEQAEANKALVFTGLEKPEQPIELLTAELQAKAFSIQRRQAVFPLTEQSVRVSGIEEAGFKGLCIDNGCIQLKASAEYAPLVYSLQHNGVEYLSSSFPKKGPYMWWNPWCGGAKTAPEMPNDALLAQKHRLEKTEWTDAKGNVWAGFFIETTMISYQPLNGLQYRQYFLLLPSAPLVLSFCELLTQNTSKTLVVFSETFVQALKGASQLVTGNVPSACRSYAYGLEDSSFFSIQESMGIQIHPDAAVFQPLTFGDVSRPFSFHSMDATGILTQNHHCIVVPNKTLRLPANVYVFAERFLQRDCFSPLSRLFTSLQL